MQGIVRVIVVDDSAFIRKVVSQMLSRSPFIEVVATARDGEEALALVEQHNPDVVTLDLIMPGLDGIGFLREQMARRPLPVVVCSIAHDCGELALAAFDAGAVELVQKPTALATDRVYEIGDELVSKVKAAAGVTMARIGETPRSRIVPRARYNGASRDATLRTDIVVLGISTGGPQALRHVIPLLPADFPVPLAIVLHMPVGYTEMYARRLNEVSSLHVAEARHGDLVQPGTVLLAPAGRHLTFAREAAGTVRARLDLRPLDTPHRPSVDVLFRSAAAVYGARTLGVVMTGMGDDGLLGAAHIKSDGGRVVTEAESSCIVYGMPRVVAEAALSDHSAALGDMADAIMEML
jgi:two-component system, chemotaxis family, protein-glutamate methylesterase/glutaminase